MIKYYIIFLVFDFILFIFVLLPHDAQSGTIIISILLPLFWLMVNIIITIVINNKITLLFP